MTLSEDMLDHWLVTDGRFVRRLVSIINTHCWSLVLAYVQIARELVTDLFLSVHARILKYEAIHAELPHASCSLFLM